MQAATMILSIFQKHSVNTSAFLPKNTQNRNTLPFSIQSMKIRLNSDILLIFRSRKSLSGPNSFFFDKFPKKMRKNIDKQVIIWYTSQDRIVKLSWYRIAIAEWSKPVRLNKMGLLGCFYCVLQNCRIFFCPHIYFMGLFTSRIKIWHQRKRLSDETCLWHQRQA